MGMAGIREENMKRELRISDVMLLLAAFALFYFVVGCNVVQRKSTTESYRISGDLLESTRLSMRALCDNGVFTPEKCAELKASYDLAAERFLEAGKAIKQANKANRAVDDILAGIKSEIRRVEQ